MLPGTNMNTSWLLAMETLKKNYGVKLDLHVSYWRYRFMQFRHLYRIRQSRWEFLKQVYKFGSPGEFIFWSLVAFPFALALRVLPVRNRFNWHERLLDLIHRSHPQFDVRRQRVPYGNILELCRNMEFRVPPSATKSPSS